MSHIAYNFISILNQKNSFTQINSVKTTGHRLTQKGSHRDKCAMLAGKVSNESFIIPLNDQYFSHYEFPPLMIINLNRNYKI